MSNLQLFTEPGGDGGGSGEGNGAGAGADTGNNGNTRLKELAGSDNKQHTPLIELVEEDPDNTAGADTAEKTSKAGKKKPENKVPENKEPAE